MQILNLDLFYPILGSKEIAEAQEILARGYNSTVAPTQTSSS